MKAIIFQLAVKIIFSMLTPELCSNLFQKLKEGIVSYVEGTPWTVDDVLLAIVMRGGQAMKEAAHIVINYAKKYVLGTASKVDDALVLPALELLEQLILK